MHQPDQEPDTRIVREKMKLTKAITYVVIIGGNALVLLGGILTILSGRSWPAVVGIMISLLSAWGNIRFAESINDEWSRSTSIMSIAITLVIALIVWAAVTFFREAVQTVA